MIIFSRSCLAALAYCFLGGSASAAGLDAIFVQEDTGDIDNIVTTTGVSTTLGTFPNPGNYIWNGTAYDPANGLIYINSMPNDNNATNTPLATQTIYSFNPSSPGTAPVAVGTIANQSAITGAGWYNGIYYEIPAGSNTLYGFSVTGGTVTQVSSQVLGGISNAVDNGGGAVTGLFMGDLDFVGSTLYITGGVVTSTNAGAAVSTQYYIFKYNSITNTTATGLAYTVAENATGVGIAYDFNSNNLIVVNSNGTIETVNQATGAESNSVTITGPAASGGAGDFAIVPEPRSYAFWSLLLLFALIFSHRALRYEGRVSEQDWSRNQASRN